MFNIKIVTKKERKATQMMENNEEVLRTDLKVISQIQWLVEASPNTYSYRKTNLHV